jgi:hypothetical protein
VAIADAYEAMVAGRPYRGAISHEAAIRELRRHGGMQFDPQLVEAFADLFAEHMPFPIDQPLHDHGDGSGQAADGRTNAEIHDALHARRRRVVPSARALEGTPTGTDG